MSSPLIYTLTSKLNYTSRAIAVQTATIVVVVCFSIGLDASAADGQPAKLQGGVPMVELQAEFVRATDAQTREILGEPTITNQSQVFEHDRAKQVLVALRKNKAEFFYNSQTIAKNGKRAVVEAVREMRYPCEFEPSKTEPGKVVPVNFETRKVGTTIEFEPTIGPDGNTIDLELVPRMDVLQGFISAVPDEKTKSQSGPWDPEELDKRLKEPLRAGTPWQPIFSYRKVTTSVSMFSGQTVGIRLELHPDDLSENPASGDDSKKGKLRTYIFVTARVITAD